MSDADHSAVRLALDDDVLSAVITRPEARNALNLEVITGLERMVATAHQRQVKAVVLRGAGGTFCAGADLHELLALVDDPGGLRSFMARLGDVIVEIERAAWVSIAVVEGYAVAGGCELLLASDIVLASGDAEIGDRHVEYGLTPAAGGSVRLPLAVPGAFARYLLLTGNLITGTQAQQIGLVSLAVEPNLVDEELERLLTRLRSRGRSSLTTVKKLIQGSDSTVRERLDRELELFLEHAASPEARTGLEAFRDGVRPVFNDLLGDVPAWRVP